MMNGNLKRSRKLINIMKNFTDCIVILILVLGITQNSESSNIPVVINTWAFNEAAQAAWNLLETGSSAVDAVEAGCSKCEGLQCDETVGWGGSPDENGETTMDALIFDGTTMDMGAVGGLRRVKDVISVAKRVLEHTKLSLLVGDQATDFAAQMGFTIEDISSEKSKKIWLDWKENNCQPNNWFNVEPDSEKSCGPYKPLEKNKIINDEHFKRKTMANAHNHDTIGMVAIDSDGNIAAGTSTNGLSHKIPGRVGDSPVPGAGGYAHSEIGGAAATGDGDVMMRFLPSFVAVDELRRGATPEEAAQIAMSRIKKYYPEFYGGLVVVDKDGNVAAACNGMDTFPYSVANERLGKAKIIEIKCEL